MPEGNVVSATSGPPPTVASLEADLRRLGVSEGAVLLVHSSLSSIGWVVGGAQAVVLALEAALGSSGTLVMPAHSGGLSEPSQWENPPVPESWWPVIRNETPAFDPDLTPSREMGAIVECFRKQSGTLRSLHPQDSFVARGRQAGKVVADHSLAFGLGEGSPLARIYELDGSVLLLGVGHENNTSLHLAEYRTSPQRRRLARNGAPVLVDGVRRWVEFEDIDLDESDFGRLGHDLEADTAVVTVGTVGAAPARLMSQRSTVDYAVAWMERNRE